MDERLSFGNLRVYNNLEMYHYIFSCYVMYHVNGVFSAGQEKSEDSKVLVIVLRLVQRLMHGWI